VLDSIHKSSNHSKRTHCGSATAPDLMGVTENIIMDGPNIGLESELLLIKSIFKLPITSYHVPWRLDR
jgi:hypothetical protein